MLANRAGGRAAAGALLPTLAVALALAWSLGCRRPAAPLAESDVAVQVTLEPSETPAGWPVVVRYCFDTGAGYRPLGPGWQAFVHFVAGDGATLVNDDHAPDPAPATWLPGRRYEYSRVVFTPRQFPGRLELRLGLFDPASGTRLRLRADHAGRGEHRVGHLSVVRLDSGSEALFGDGFHGPEGDLARPFVAWRASAAKARLLFRNPHAEAVLFLRAWAFAPPAARPRLRLLAGGLDVRRPLPSDRPGLVVVRLSRAQLGDEEWSPVELEADPTAVAPAPDRRTLGVAIENAVLAPLGRLDPGLRALVE